MDTYTYICIIVLVMLVFGELIVNILFTLFDLIMVTLGNIVAVLVGIFEMLLSVLLNPISWIAIITVATVIYLR